MNPLHEIVNDGHEIVNDRHDGGGFDYPRGGDVGSLNDNYHGLGGHSLNDNYHGLGGHSSNDDVHGHGHGHSVNLNDGNLNDDGNLMSDGNFFPDGCVEKAIVRNHRAIIGGC